MTRDGEGEEEVYKVRRVQAQSMEIKKGILVAWRSSKSTQDNKQIVEVPNVVISEPMSTSYSLINDHLEAATSDAPSSMYMTEGDGSDDGLLHAPIPSFTCVFFGLLWTEYDVWHFLGSLFSNSLSFTYKPW